MLYLDAIGLNIVCILVIQRVIKIQFMANAVVSSNYIVLLTILVTLALYL